MRRYTIWAMLWDVLTLGGIVACIWWAIWKHEHRLNRIEYWIGVHSPLIPSYASPAEVKERAGRWPVQKYARSPFGKPWWRP